MGRKSAVEAFGSLTQVKKLYDIQLDKEGNRLVIFHPAYFSIRNPTVTEDETVVNISNGNAWITLWKNRLHMAFGEVID